MSEIIKTNDYSIFKYIARNREIKRENVDKLKRSISLRNLLHVKPILVDADFGIIDGQHRLEAAKELGCPVYYQKSLDYKDQDLFLLQQAQVWNNADYLNYYAKGGNPHYISLAAFIRKNPLSVSLVVKALCGKGSKAKEFIKGNFVFVPEDAEYLRESLQYVKEVQDLILKKSFDCLVNVKGSVFTAAIVNFLNYKKVNRDTFKEKLLFGMDKLRPCTTLRAYMSLFQQIYNWKNHQPIDIESLEN